MRGLRIVVAAAFVTGWMCAGATANPAYITGVPDWNQPVLAPGGPALNTGWNAWCVPTASANIMGYYRDKGAAANIADGLIFSNTNAWGVATTNFQDDTADSSKVPGFGINRADIGWYMNTNDTGQTATVPGNHFIGTNFSSMKPGLDGSGGGFTGYFPAHGINNATVTNAASTALLNTAAGGPFTTATVWPRIQTEINAGRPVLISFTHFGLLGRQSVRATGPANMPDYDYAVWNLANPPQSDPSTGEGWTNPDIGHTVTLVGYWLGDGVDATNPFYVAGNPALTPNAVIVYDNRDGSLAGPARGLPLALPFDATAPWVMNTEITLPAVPEPATMLLLGTGGLLMVLRRGRRGE